MENLPVLTILFILNPTTGSEKKVNIENQVKNYFKDLPHIIHFYILTGKDDTGSINYWIEKLQVTRVAAAGGDGTINFVAKHLLGSSLALGIIPTGSANGMAKELNIPDTLEEALHIIINGKIKNCDVIKINEDSISIHLSDLGLNARLIKYFDENALRGMYGYARMLVKVLWYKKLMSAHIVTDDKDINTNAYMIVLANASKYGTGAVINPGGDTTDGFFEIAIVRRVSLLNIIRMFFKNASLYPKHVEILKTKKAVITTKQKTHFQVDGEYKGKMQKVTAEIMTSKLNILIKDA